MSTKKIALAAGIGVVVGYLLSQQVSDKKSISPEKALDNAKETFRRQAPISGSWIYMKPEDIEENGLTYHAYRGGISRNIDGENKQYEFFVDTDTGTVVGAHETH